MNLEDLGHEENKDILSIRYQCTRPNNLKETCNTDNIKMFDCSCLLMALTFASPWWYTGREKWVGYGSCPVILASMLSAGEGGKISL